MTPAPYRRIEECICLDCGRQLDAIGSPDNGPCREPRPGDPIACIRCGAVMTYEAGHLRGFTDAEMKQLVADTETMDELAHLIKGIHILAHMEH